jgi:Fe-Mn family superoxide dismutase
MLLNRRQLLKAAGVGAASLVLSRLAPLALAEGKSSEYTLVKLPYAYDALEPYIDAETMRIHHDKHHAAYVAGLNNALKNQPELKSKKVHDLLTDIKSVPESIRQAVINFGGGDYNHTLFWSFMAPNAGGQPQGALAKDISNTFGSFDAFVKQFNEAAARRFGSGWAWLVIGKDGQFKVMSTANQDSPLLTGATPVLGIDVWEHAYYLKYKNERPKYVNAWWNVVNWSFVADRVAEAKKSS